MKKLTFLIIITFLFFGCADNKKKVKTEQQKQEESMKILAQEMNELIANTRKKLVKVWETDTVMTTSESVLYDDDRRILYVANINGVSTEKDGNGFISQLSTSGEVKKLKWVTGLDAPKGMGRFGNKLYVTNITEIAEIDIETAKITNRYTIEGATFMNDITVDKTGVVYVSDSFANKIYQLKDGKLSIWLENDLNKPNGLYIEGNRMLVASWGAKNLRSISLKTKKITDLVTEIGDGDGIVPVNNSTYLVSSWSGAVYFINSKLEKQEVLNTQKEQISSADIEFVKSEKLLLVPTFGTNTVVAYKLQ